MFLIVSASTSPARAEKFTTIQKNALRADFVLAILAAGIGALALAHCQLGSWNFACITSENAIFILSIAGFIVSLNVFLFFVLTRANHSFDLFKREMCKTTHTLSDLTQMQEEQCAQDENDILKFQNTLQNLWELSALQYQKKLQ